MIEILPETQSNILAVRVTGELTNDDFSLYRKLIHERMKAYEDARLYYEMADLNWVEPSVAIENGMFDIVHGREYGRVAMVGEKKWQEWVAKLISPVKKKGVRYFDLAEKEHAMAWVQEGE